MANEIKRDVKLSWSKRGAQIVASTSETIDQAGTNAFESVQIIGTASEAISIGDVTDTTGDIHFMFKNMNKPWSELTTAEKNEVAGADTAAKKITYELSHTVHVGTTSPVTSANAEFSLVPGAGVSFRSVITAWFGIRETNDVDLLVCAIEA